MENLLVRPFRAEDAEITAKIFFDAVRHGTRDHYDEAQRKAWAPQIPEISKWLDRLQSQSVFVAERANRIVGFMTLTSGGYIDLAFVAPDMMGQGVAGKLYAAVLSEASALGLSKLHSEASYFARTFFQRQGWSVVREQTVVREGVTLTNFLMKITLNQAGVSSVGTSVQD